MQIKMLLSMRTVSCKDQFEWGEKFSLLVLLQQNILEVISKMFTIEHKRLSLLLSNKNCLHESWIYMTSNGLTNCTVRYWIVLPCNFLLSTKIFHFWWCSAFRQHCLRTWRQTSGRWWWLLLVLAFSTIKWLWRTLKKIQAASSFNLL